MLKDIISFADFQKLEMRVGTILRAERVEGSQKLIRMEIDCGEEKRQIVAGLAQTHVPEQLENLQVIVLVNLAPKMMMGIESQGMLLAADSEESVTLLTPLKPMPNGSVIR